METGFTYINVIMHVHDFGSRSAMMYVNEIKLVGMFCTQWLSKNKGQYINPCNYEFVHITEQGNNLLF